MKNVKELRARAKELRERAEKYRQLMIKGIVHGDVYMHAAGLMYKYDAEAYAIRCEVTRIITCKEMECE